MKKNIFYITTFFFLTNFFSTTPSLFAGRLMLSHTKTPNSATFAASPKKTIALFDTSQIDRYCYYPTLQMAHANNFDINYYPISKILDTPLETITFEKHDCAFFLLCPEFLKTLRPTTEKEASPVSQKILALIKKFSSMPNKMTCFMFPPIKLAHQNPLEVFAPLFSQLGIVSDYSSTSNPMFEELTNRFLKLPIELRPLAYHTTLTPPKSGSSFNVEQSVSGNTMPLALLPIKQDNHPLEIKNLFPFGVYYFNEKRNNHLFISSTSLLSFSGISENFKICPMEFSLREKIHSALNETVWEIYQALASNTQGIDTQKILNCAQNPLPETIKLLGNNTKPMKNKKSYKIAWMEIGVFSPARKENDKEKHQEELIQYILSSGLNYLWISFNPHIYYSPIGNNKHKKDDFLQTVELFTDALAEKATEAKIKPPELLIGFEIANNLYGANLPKQVARDLYGNSYKDVPRPLDETFWENEVKTPLALFLDDWDALKIADPIKIAGVIIDLEMYGRKTTGQFLPTMGFEQNTIATFLTPPLSESMTPHIFVEYLIKNQLCSKYFSHLEEQSEKLGQNLRDFFTEQLPKGIIGCYAPNISIDWFYKGLYRGLSTPEKPIHLLTFNSEFQSHKPWLAKNEIQTYHSSALMLSKLKDKKDFTLVDHILEHHDGVWLNRFSRMAEPYHEDWSTLEQTTLDTAGRIKFADYLCNHRKETVPTTQPPVNTTSTTSSQSTTEFNHLTTSKTNWHPQAVTTTGTSSRLYLPIETN